MTTLLVVLLHWAALHHLPWSLAAAAVPSQRSSFQTRTIAPTPVQPEPVATLAAPVAAPASVQKTVKTHARPQKVQPAASTHAATNPASSPSAAVAQSHEPIVEAVSPDSALADLAAANTENAANLEAFAQGAASAESNLPKADAVVAAAATVPDAAAVSGESANLAEADQARQKASAGTTDHHDNPRGPGIEFTLPGGAGHRALQKPLSAQWPAPKRLLFDVSGQAKRFNYNASAALTWQHDGKTYQAEQKISAFLVGQRIQRSVGDIQGNVLAPVRFSDKSRSEKAAHFNHAEHTVTFSSNAPSAPLDVGAQDRLSVFIQLAAWFKAAPDQFTQGSTITVTTVSTSKADRWAFRVEGRETLELPAGTMSTIKLQRLPREQYDQKAELWLAPDIDYLPARIRLTQTNGDFADLKLSGHENP